MVLNAISRVIGGCISNTVVSETLDYSVIQGFLFYYTNILWKGGEKEC